MQFFFFFLSPSLGRSDILRDNYLATGHEYNTDGTPRRLTVKPALSLLAVNSCHSPPPSLPRTSSRAVASFTCSSIFSAANTFTVFHTRSRKRAASLMDALLWWCGQRRGITVMRSSQQSKSLHGGGGVTQILVVLLLSSQTSIWPSQSWVWRDNKDKLSGISIKIWAVCLARQQVGRLTSLSAASCTYLVNKRGGFLSAVFHF